MAIDKTVDSAVLDAKFTAIADAIREKSGTSKQYTDTEMPDAIRAIETGIDTSDATATAAHILKNQTAYANGKKITGTIESQGAQTITPGTLDITIAADKYLSGNQIIKGDANLKAGNIKNGVSIFGVEGTYTGDGVKVLSKTGTFYFGEYTSGQYQQANLSLGFVPDAIIIYFDTTDVYKGVYSYQNSASAVFTLSKYVHTYMISNKYSSDVKLDFLFNVISNGVRVQVFKNGSTGGVSTSTAFKYIAYKFT